VYDDPGKGIYVLSHNEQKKILRRLLQDLDPMLVFTEVEVLDLLVNEEGIKILDEKMTVYAGSLGKGEEKQYSLRDIIEQEVEFYDDN
jgi:hypothetical protein